MLFVIFLLQELMEEALSTLVFSSFLCEAYLVLTWQTDALSSLHTNNCTIF